MRPPLFTDILDAKRVVDRYLQPTPLHHYPRLSAELGFDIFIKHENHQPVGAFKIRGGIKPSRRWHVNSRPGPSPD